MVSPDKNNQAKKQTPKWGAGAILPYSVPGSLLTGKAKQTHSAPPKQVGRPTSHAKVSPQPPKHKGKVAQPPPVVVSTVFEPPVEQLEHAVNRTLSGAAAPLNFQAAQQQMASPLKLLQPQTPTHMPLQSTVLVHESPAPVATTHVKATLTRLAKGVFGPRNLDLIDAPQSALPRHKSTVSFQPEHSDAARQFTQSFSAAVDLVPPASAALPVVQEDDSGSVVDEAEVQHRADMAFGKLRARFQLRAMANRWRQTAVANVLPGLRPFIPRLLTQEMLALAKWYVHEDDEADDVSSDSRKLYQTQKHLRPSKALFRGALMIADITGFTKLTELLSKQGASGVELLTNCINDYFSKVMHVVQSFGGDVIKFAGDALIIAFYPLRAELTNDDGGYHRTVLRCAHCALQLADELGHMEMLPSGAVIPVERSQVPMHLTATAQLAEAVSTPPISTVDRNVSTFLRRLKKPSAHGQLLQDAAHAKIDDAEAAEPAVRTKRALTMRRLLTRSRTRSRPGSLSTAGEDASDRNLSQRSASGSMAEPAWPSSRFGSKRLTNRVGWTHGAYAALAPASVMTCSEETHIMSLKTDSHEGAAAPVAEAREELACSDAAPVRPSGFIALGNIMRAWRPIAAVAPAPGLEPAAAETTAQEAAGAPRPQSCPHGPVAALHAKQVLGQALGTPAAQSIGLHAKQALAQAATNFARAAAHARHAAASERHGLSLKVMCGSGEMVLYHCGGCATDSPLHDGGAHDKLARWEYFLGDAAFAPAEDARGHRQVIAQISAIEEHATSGEVVISREMLEGLGTESLTADELPDGAARLRALTPVQPELERDAMRSDAKEVQEDLPSHVIARAAPLLRMHVVDNVRQKLEAGHFDFINEIRQLTILFMGFPSLKQPDPEHAHELQPVQHTVMTVLRTISELEGSFVQFRCDEKGFLAICAFGLPGVAHSNDPERGILAALRMQSLVESSGHSFACGVTTGALLCACVGSKVRSEYTMFGDAINLSARLMCKAKAGLATIITDQATREKAETKADYGELQPLALKGKAELAQVYSVHLLAEFDMDGEIASSIGARASTFGGAHSSMVGREPVLQVVRELARELVQERSTALLLVYGPAGLGKTKLLRHLQYKEEYSGWRSALRFFSASGSPELRPIPLTPWRTIVESMFTVALQRQRDEQLFNSRTRRSISQHVLNFHSNVIRWSSNWPKVRELLIQQLQLDPGILPPVNTLFADGKSADGAAPSLLMLTAPCPAAMAAISPHGTLESSGSTGEGVEASAHHVANVEGSADTSGAAGSAAPYGDPAGGRRMSRILSAPSATQSASASHSRAGTLSASGGLPTIESIERAASERIDSDAPVTPRRSVVFGQHDHFSGHADLALDAQPTSSARRILRPALKRNGSDDESRRRGSPGALGVPSQLANEVPDAVGVAAAHGSTSLSQSATRAPPATLARSWDVKASQQRLDLASPRLRTLAKPETLSKDLHNVILTIICAFVDAFGPVGILLDDLHHFDIASWHLLHALCEEVSDGCLVVATLRDKEGVLADKAATGDADKNHIHQAAEAVLDRLEALPCQQCMTLEPFSAVEVRDMMMRSLPTGHALHESNVQTVLAQTSGHPVHIEQVMFYLESREGVQDTLKVPHGLAMSKLDELAPDMRQIITSRVDALRPNAQLTLKVCSVMGQYVRLEVLVRTHPSAGKVSHQQLRKQLAEDLGELVLEGFLEHVRDRADVWHWQSHVARDHVYAIQGPSNVRDFHAAAAAALEAVGTAAHGLPLSHVAWHWTLSCDSQNLSPTLARHAIRCWKAAASDVAERGAFLDAVRFMSKALDISETLLSKDLRMSLRGVESQEVDLDAVNVFSVAQQHMFRADMYFKLLVSPEQKQNEAELVESCQRNCLLVLSLCYMPMPCMPRADEAMQCASCSCFASCRHIKFAGSTALLQESKSAAVARSLVALSTPTSALPSFSLAKLQNGGVKAVYAHEYTKAEADLARDAIELLFVASSPPVREEADAAMMMYCSQALEWLRDRTEHMDPREANHILDEFAFVSKKRSTGLGRHRASSRHSEAILSVIASGMSIADIQKPRNHWLGSARSQAHSDRWAGGRSMLL